MHFYFKKQKRECIERYILSKYSHGCDGRIGPAFFFPDFALPPSCGTGGAAFFGICVILLLSVPCGARGSGRLMPAFAMVPPPYTSFRPADCFFAVLLRFWFSLVNGVCPSAFSFRTRFGSGWLSFGIKTPPADSIRAGGNAILHSRPAHHIFYTVPAEDVI